MELSLLSLLCLLGALSRPGQAVQSSHVQVTIGGSSYEHGRKHELPHPASPPPPPAPAAYAPARRPHYPSPAPLHYAPEPAMPHMAAAAPHHPAAAPHHTAVHYAAAAPHYSHHQPRYMAHMAGPNCTLVDDMLVAEVCTPTLTTVCSKEELMIKRVVEKEQCQDITRTVCTESMVDIPSTICTYTYDNQQVMATAQNVEIRFEKMCREEMITVCEPAHSGYGYGGYGKQQCKEVGQQVCYNAPMASPIQEKVELSYPVPMMDCSQHVLSLPTVLCEDIMDKKCFMVPMAMDDKIVADKCTVDLGEPTCRPVELTVPKQVCRSMPSYQHGSYHM